MNIDNQRLIKTKKKSVLDIIVKSEETIIFVSGCFIALAMFGQVVLRYIFRTPLFGLEEISVLVVSWFYFIGAAYSIHTGSYIKADVLPLITKNPHIIRISNIVSFILTLVATLLLFYYTSKFAIWMDSANVVTPTFLISQNVSFSALVVGSLLMSLHFFLLLYKEIKRKI